MPYNFDLTPARKPRESLKTYRNRQKQNKANLKEYLQGTPVWVSVVREYIFLTTYVTHKVQGTYRRGTQ